MRSNPDCSVVVAAAAVWQARMQQSYTGAQRLCVSPVLVLQVEELVQLLPCSRCRQSPFRVPHEQRLCLPGSSKRAPATLLSQQSSSVRGSATASTIDPSPLGGKISPSIAPDRTPRISADFSRATPVQLPDCLHACLLLERVQRGRRCMWLVQQVSVGAGVELKRERCEISHPRNLVSTVTFVSFVKRRCADAAHDDVGLVPVDILAPRPRARVQWRSSERRCHRHPRRLVGAPMPACVRGGAERLH